MPGLAPPGSHHPIVLAFIIYHRALLKSLSRLPKRDHPKGNGTFKSPSLSFPSSASPKLHSLGLCTDSALHFCCCWLAHSVSLVYSIDSACHLVQPLNKLTRCPSKHFPYFRVLIMTPAKEAVVSLPGSFWKAPLVSGSGNWHSCRWMDKGWAGFQGNGILGISHPPKRKEQIMQILGTRPLATPSAPLFSLSLSFWEGVGLSRKRPRLSSFLITHETGAQR